MAQLKHYPRPDDLCSVMTRGSNRSPMSLAPQTDHMILIMEPDFIDALVANMVVNAKTLWENFNCY